MQLEIMPYFVNSDHFIDLVHGIFQLLFFFIPINRIQIYNKTDSINQSISLGYLHGHDSLASN